MGFDTIEINLVTINNVVTINVNFCVSNDWKKQHIQTHPKQVINPVNRFILPSSVPVGKSNFSLVELRLALLSLSDPASHPATQAHFKSAV